MSNSALFSAGSSTFEPSDAVVEPPSIDNRYFTKVKNPLTGLSQTLQAGDSVSISFAAVGADSDAKVLLRGTDSNGTHTVDLFKSHRADCSIRISNGGSTVYFVCPTLYSHGCFNTVTLTADASDPQLITVNVNGTDVDTRDVGGVGPLFFDRIETGLRWIKSFEHVRAGSSILKYDFLESGNATIFAPTVGSGNLATTSVARQEQFNLVDGVWVCSLPDDAKIFLPEDAPAQRNAPVTTNVGYKIWGGYGQSLGRWFMNGETNEMRHASVVNGAYTYGTYLGSSAMVSKFVPRNDIMGAGYTLMEGLVAQDDIGWLYTNAAQSSTEIANLSKGSSSYTSLTNILPSFISNMPAGGSIESYNVSFVQGEQDGSVGTLPSVYKARHNQLVNDLRDDARSYTSNNALPFKFLYTQVGFAGAQSLLDIEWSQYELFKEYDETDSDVIYVGPVHFLNLFYKDALDVPPDGVHLNPLGYTIMEEYFVEAATNPNYKAIKTISALADIEGGGITVVVTVKAQTLPIRKFDSITSDPTMGVILLSPTGSEIIPTSVVINNDKITLTMASPVADGSKVLFGYGRSGLPSVNIIDSTEWLGRESGITHSHWMSKELLTVTSSNIPPPNTAPTVPTITRSNSGTLAAGGTATLTASSTDDNGPITYNWSTDIGSVSANTDNSVVFTAPTGSSAVTATISCTASDGSLTSAAGTVSIDVAAVVIQSTLNMAFTNLDDGTYETYIVNTDDGTVLANGDSVAFVDGGATVTIADVGAGANVLYSIIGATVGGQTPCGLQRGNTE